MSRRVWIVLALFTSLVLASGVVLTRTRHNINRQGFERLRVGMTEDEVEAVLGRPAGDYSTGAIALRHGLHSGPYRPVQTPPKEWTSNEGSISVCFDGGRVTGAEYNEVYHFEEALLDKFRRWMGL